MTFVPLRDIVRIDNNNLTDCIMGMEEDRRKMERSVFQIQGRRRNLKEIVLSTICGGRRATASMNKSKTAIFTVPVSCYKKQFT